jgi:thiol-disulfide isomerase/thioredoxin
MTFPVKPLIADALFVFGAAVFLTFLVLEPAQALTGQPLVLGQRQRRVTFAHRLLSIDRCRLVAARPLSASIDDSLEGSSPLLPSKIFNKRNKKVLQEIKSEQHLQDFLRQHNGRAGESVAVVLYHASWCKSCQKFCRLFEQLARDSSNSQARFGTVEFGSNKAWCQSAPYSIKRLPTVHFYDASPVSATDTNGDGVRYLTGVTVGPKQFHLVVETMGKLQSALEMKESKQQQSLNDISIESESKSVSEGVRYVRPLALPAVQQGDARKSSEEEWEEIFAQGNRLISSSGVMDQFLTATTADDFQYYDATSDDGASGGSSRFSLSALFGRK